VFLLGGPDSTARSGFFSLFGACIVKCQARGVLVLLSVATIFAGAQSSTQNQSSAQETQLRGHWVDPSTGLMWTAKDNGKDVNWHLASEYCSGLRLAGYSDWRLPAIDELEGIYERNAKSSGEIPGTRKKEAYSYTFDVKGDIFLTGNPWSSSRIDDNPGHPPENGWFVYFNQGSRIYEELSDSHSKRALCVRRSKVVPAAPAADGAQTATETQKLAHENQARGYWVDPSTGLMWAWRDNGKDVSWHKAMKYCRDLRLADFSDWRLATITELQGIYDSKAEAPGENPRSPWHDAEFMAFPVKGNLFLTSDREWSSSPELDVTGQPDRASYWYLDLQKGWMTKGFEDPLEGDHMHALCVRGSKAAPITPSNGPMVVGAQSSTGSSTSTLAPQVRPALPQEQSPAPQKLDAASREKAEAEKVRSEAKAQEERRLAQETQERGYWVDHATGLMWEGKDNGIEATWHKAASYCRNLRLAGYPDWRLATLDELASLVDKSAPTSERVGNTETFYINFGRHVRGGLSLTGNPWSSTREIDRFGHPYGDGWFFDFVDSKPSGDLPYFRNTKYALCVRRSRE